MKAFFQKLDKLPLREQMALLLAFIAVLLCLTDWLVVRPISRKLKDYDARIEQAKLDRDDSLFLLTREKELKAEYQRIENTIAKVASPSEALAKMKGEIYDVAKQNSLTINAMDQKELPDNRPDRPYQRYAVEVGKFEAEMKDLMAFLYQADTAPGLMRVVRLNIVPGKTKNSAAGSILLAKVMLVENAGGPKGEAPVAPAAPKR